MNIQITVNPATVAGKEIGNGYLEIRAVIGKKTLVSPFTFRDIKTACAVKSAVEEIFHLADGNFADVEFYVAEHTTTKEWYLFVDCFDSCKRLSMLTRRIAKGFSEFVQNCLDTTAEESFKLLDLEKKQ